VLFGLAQRRIADEGDKDIGLLFVDWVLLGEEFLQRSLLGFYSVVEEVS
jgi:hypothetical protein